MLEFRTWSKIPRLSSEIWEVTEKIDGTNGVIAISDDLLTIEVGSRNRWLSVNDDNYGLCRWVMTNYFDILKLGPGYHYGEWYGKGIQRGYGLEDRRFALFYLAKGAVKPDCCELVPKLCLDGRLDKALEYSLGILQIYGSRAAFGYKNPEGVIIRSSLTGTRYKYILE